MEEDKKHYVCKGTCGGASKDPNTCSTTDCANKGVAMEECGCGNSEHATEDKPVDGQ